MVFKRTDGSLRFNSGAACENDVGLDGIVVAGTSRL